MLTPPAATLKLRAADYPGDVWVGVDFDALAINTAKVPPLSRLR
jgi:hypothetical protein